MWVDNILVNIVTNQDHQFPAVLRINQFKKKVNESLLSLRKRKMRANVEFNLTPEAKYLSYYYCFVEEIMSRTSWENWI